MPRPPNLVIYVSMTMTTTWVNIIHSLSTQHGSTDLPTDMGSDDGPNPSSLAADTAILMLPVEKQ